jgi:hypothetical protein
MFTSISDLISWWTVVFGRSSISGDRRQADAVRKSADDLEDAETALQRLLGRPRRRVAVGTRQFRLNAWRESRRSCQSKYFMAIGTNQGLPRQTGKVGKGRTPEAEAASVVAWLVREIGSAGAALA